MNIEKKGYVVLYQCGKGTLKVGKREWEMEDGTYLYVGSCGKNCSARVGRHLALEVRRKRWHVDHLKGLCRPVSVLVLSLSEPEIVGRLPSVRALHGFGSSDYPEHVGHLFKVSLDEVLHLLIA